MVACPECGTEVPAGASFCLRCGRLADPAPPPPPGAAGASATAAGPPRPRPLGIALLGGLGMVGGCALVLGGLATLALATLAVPEDLLREAAAAFPGMAGEDPVRVLLYGAAVSLVLGGGSAAAGWGLWRGRRWAFRAVVAVLAANVLLALPGLPGGGLGPLVGGLLYGALIVWYLRRPTVRAYLGLAPGAEAGDVRGPPSGP